MVLRDQPYGAETRNWTVVEVDWENAKTHLLVVSEPTVTQADPGAHNE